jgi:lycopene beta-cyclase
LTVSRFVNPEWSPTPSSRRDAAGRTDVLLVGGGLANLLIAWRLAGRQPDVRFGILEAGPEVGGNHTWSFHESDLDPVCRSWVVPLATAGWDGYDVRFATHRRTLPGRYLSIASADLRARVTARFGERVQVNAPVAHLTPTEAVLADGSRLAAGVVIDGRGWDAAAGMDVGYQTFLGRDVELEAPHGLERPLIMDATIPQRGGYRFMYLLPWSPTSLLIEPTAYADSPDVDEAGSRVAIEEYVAGRGWRVTRMVREERGSLPIPLAGAFEDLPAAGGVATVGVRAGLFHAGTGYSLPIAARVAELVAATDLTATAALAPLLERFARAHWARQRYFRLLNRMLFRAAQPTARYRVLARFYRLPPGLVARFYAGRLTVLDKARILAGRPPVPIGRAVRAALARRSAP